MQISRIYNETDISFYKRYAYFERFLKGRLHHAELEFEQLKRGAYKPLSKVQHNHITTFWVKYMQKDKIDEIIDVKWYSVYNAIKQEHTPLVHYLPNGFYYVFIDEYFSNPQHSSYCDDKNFYDLYFPDVLRPKTICRKISSILLDDNYNPISLDNKLLNKLKNGAIVKPSKFSSSGKNIIFIAPNSTDDEIRNALMSTGPFICQELIHQHPEMSKLHAKSVNTIRMLTFFWKDEVMLLSTIVRMGQGDSMVDNRGAGGMLCGVKQDGYLQEFGYDSFPNRYQTSPDGYRFSEIQIPNFDALKKMVKKLHYRLCGTSRLLSWDLSIDEHSNPILIECNFTFGGCIPHQLCNGPIFSTLTEEVLLEVFDKSYTLKQILLQ